MKIIYVDTLDFSDVSEEVFKEEYQYNILVLKDGNAIYVLNKIHYFIPQRLLDEIVYLQNFDPSIKDVNTTDVLENENEIEAKTDATLSMKELVNLSTYYTADDLCNLREAGLI